MSNNTQVAVLPTANMIPAYLQSPDIAAEIAAANAAAAGGIKAGGFPSISIKSNHFHVKMNGELHTLYDPQIQGQPLIPKMCLQIVVVSANPALSKTYYPGEWVEGSSDEPACRSGNGVTPDTDVAEPQFAACAICPQNQWGSAVSKISGKPITACKDGKQLAVLAADDLAGMVVGLKIGGGSLGNWGKYISALDGRGYKIGTLVTNVTFDATQNGVLNFGFSRFLEEHETMKVLSRRNDADVQTIVSQSRAIVAAPALPAPAAQPALTYAPNPAPVAASAVVATPVMAPAPAPAPVAPIVGFGAAAPNGAPPAPPGAGTATEPPKRTRAKRTPVEAPAQPASEADLNYLPEGVRETIMKVGGPTSASGKSILASFPRLAVPAGAVDLSHLSPEMRAAVESVGATSPAGMAMLAMFPRPAAQPAPAPAPVAQPAAPVQPAPLPAAAPIAAPSVGFGAAAPAPAAQAPSPAVTAAGASLKALLEAKLGINGAGATA